MASDQEQPSSIDRNLERAEADTVLASDLFKRARSLRQILSYVCEQYFSGDTPNIKEYNIAVEALGRSADFDPNLDTIVRVEASRLRKRLREYYATEGADHPVQLFLPNAGYVPQFVPRPDPAAQAAVSDADGTPALAEDAAEPPALPSAPAGEAVRRAPDARILWLVVAAVVLTSGIAFFLLRRGGSKAEPRGAQTVSSRTVAAAPAAPQEAQTADAVRILAGYMRSPFTDSLGRLWLSDRYFQGGSVQDWADEVVGVTDPTLYCSVRQGREFRYDIPLKPGVYELRLMLVENYFGKLQMYNSGEGSRVFSVTVNGVVRLPRVDTFADAGGAGIPADRVLGDISPAADGMLHLAFSGLSDWASVNGIEIVRAITPGRMNPVRIAAGNARSYNDRDGRFWGADRYFAGGRMVRKPVPFSNTADPELYVNSRWGRFTYSIPVVPDSRYRVTLKFAETFFGPSVGNDGGAGSRVFDVSCNGLPLLRNFDVFREAGGEGRAVDRVFHGIAPNGQGRLTLSFAPAVDYATVSGIEVVDEGK